MQTPIQTLGMVLDALNEELNADGTREGMCSFTIHPGDTTIADYGTESCGGMSWLRLVGANTTANFPSSNVTVNNCTFEMAFTAEVGILRPAILPDVNGINEIDLPTDMERFEEADLQLKDMMAMKRALASVGSGMDNFIIQAYTPLGPDGGIVGGSWSFVFGEE